MKQFTLGFVFRMALVAFATAATAVHAVPVVGLTQGNELISFDTSTPGATTAPVIVTGLGAGEILVGIDYRPATEQLYGLGSGSNLYIVNAATGAATLVAPLTNSAGGGPVLLNGTSFGFDFNPTTDRLRIVSNFNQNIRVNPANGVTIFDGTLNPGDPNVVGAAYTNNFPVASSTILYVLDSALDDLLVQAPANAGTLTSVGDLGVDFDDNVGFDILGAGSAFASLNTGGPATGFYSINLVTGAATLIGDIGGGSFIADIAITFVDPAQVPLPSTLALLGLGLASFAWGRRKK